MAEFELCPSCKIALVPRKPGKGKTARCQDCLKKHHAVDADHYDANGVRYGTLGRVVMRACKYCGTEYQRRRCEPREPACDECLPLHRKLQAENYKLMLPNFPYKQRHVQVRYRMIQKLKKAGLPEDWYDKQPKVCGICGVDHPGRSGRWHIDHDHRCCPYTKRGTVVGCHKCIRGLLCIKCNMALGLLNDDPARLRKAIEWITRPLPYQHDTHATVLPAAAD